MSIAENLKRLKGRIENKCRECKRDPHEIKLVAVSKNFGLPEIEEAIRCGIKDFGENRAQELLAKFEALGERVIWHFIGTLQKNKVKYAVRTAEYIHSVISKDLAEEIDKQAAKRGIVQKVLIQIKTSYEETKTGAAGKEEIKELFSYCTDAENLELVGLMTMAPFTDDENMIRKSFSDLRILQDELDPQKNILKELSMGMTSDFEIAIEEGATMLRIGFAIFGERNYK
jgi:pyridoxal phosphate enzyme (YggS family)